MKRKGGGGGLDFKERVVGALSPTRVCNVSIANKVSSTQAIFCFLECVFTPSWLGR